MKQDDGTVDAAIAQAVAHWRAGVRHLEGAELDELADHVVSSARPLAGGALTPDEAVCIAARRLGAERELVREFERGDGRTRNFDSLALVLLGAAAALVLVPLTKVYMAVTVLLVGFLGLGDHPWTQAVEGLLFLAPFALLVPLMRWRGAPGALTRVARRPGLCLAAAFVLLCLPYVVRIDMTARLSAQEYRQVFFGHGSAALAYLVPGLLAPLALLTLALHRTRRAAVE